MTDDEYLEKMALKLHENNSEEASQLAGLDELFQQSVLKEEIANLENGMERFLELNDTHEGDEVAQKFFGDLEVVEETEKKEVTETPEQNIVIEQKEVTETPEQKFVREQKEELALLRAEAVQAKKQADEDQALLLKAMQSVIENQNNLIAKNQEVKTEVKEAPVVDKQSDIKNKSKNVYAKLVDADDSAGDDLAELLSEIANNNKTTPITTEQIALIVEQSIQKKEIENYNVNFQKVNNEFFANNKDIVDNPTSFKLYKSNFDSLYNEYQNKGVRPNPEDLFTKAKEITKNEIEALTGKKVVQKNADINIKVSESLQVEAAKSEKAKTISPTTQASAKVEVKPTERFDQMKAYREMLAKQGIAKF